MIFLPGATLLLLADILGLLTKAENKLPPLTMATYSLLIWLMPVHETALQLQ